MNYPRASDQAIASLRLQIAMWPHATKEFILVVVLCGFLSVPFWDGKNGGLQLVELFSGVGRIARLGSWVGLRSRAFDLSYLPLKNPLKMKRGKIRRPAMDLNGSAGLVFLIETCGFHVFLIFTHALIVFCSWLLPEQHINLF